MSFFDLNEIYIITISLQLLLQSVYNFLNLIFKVDMKHFIRRFTDDLYLILMLQLGLRL